MYLLYIEISNNERHASVFSTSLRICYSRRSSLDLSLAGTRLLAMTSTTFLNATCSCFVHTMTTGKHSTCYRLPVSDQTSCCCCRPPLLILIFTNTITLHPQRSF